MTDENDMDFGAPRHLEIGSVYHPGQRKRRLGAVLLAVCPVVMTLALVTAALTINSCGPIGRSCEEYGSHTRLGEVMIFVAFGAAILFFVGLVLLALGRTQQR